MKAMDIKENIHLIIKYIIKMTSQLILGDGLFNK